MEMRNFRSELAMRQEDIANYIFRFAMTLERACVETIEEGKMTKDLAICIHGTKVR